MSLDDQHGIELTQVKFVWNISTRARERKKKSRSSSMVPYTSLFCFHSHQWSIVNVQNPNLIDVDLMSNDFYLQHYVHRTKRYSIDALKSFIISIFLLLATTYCPTRCSILHNEENSDDFIMSIGKRLSSLLLHTSFLIVTIFRLVLIEVLTLTSSR